MRDQPFRDVTELHDRAIRSLSMGMRGRVQSERPFGPKRSFSYETATPVSMFAHYVGSTLPAVGEPVSEWPDSSGNGRDLLLTNPGVPAPTVMTGVNGEPALNMGNASEFIASFAAVEVENLAVLVVCGWGPFNGISPTSDYTMVPMGVYQASPAMFWLWLSAYRESSAGEVHAVAVEAQNDLVASDLVDQVTPGSPLLLQATRELGAGATLRYHDDAAVSDAVAHGAATVDSLFVSSWQGPLNEIRVYDPIPDLTAVRAELNTTYALGLT